MHKSTRGEEGHNSSIDNNVCYYSNYYYFIIICICRKEDESRDEYGVWCNGIKVTLYGMCELFDQKMVEVVATSSVRPSVKCFGGFQC